MGNARLNWEPQISRNPHRNVATHSGRQMAEVPNKGLHQGGNSVYAEKLSKNFCWQIAI